MKNKINKLKFKELVEKKLVEKKISKSFFAKKMGRTRQNFNIFLNSDNKIASFFIAVLLELGVTLKEIDSCLEENKVESIENNKNV